jgi:hypothetical protein
MHIYIVKMRAATYNNTLEWIHPFADIFCHITILLQITKSISEGSYVTVITGTIKETDFMYLYKLPMFYVVTRRDSTCDSEIFFGLKDTEEGSKNDGRFYHTNENIPLRYQGNNKIGKPSLSLYIPDKSGDGLLKFNLHVTASGISVIWTCGKIKEGTDSSIPEISIRPATNKQIFIGSNNEPV